MSQADVELVTRLAAMVHGDLKANAYDANAITELEALATPDYEFVFAEHEALDIGGVYPGVGAGMAVLRTYLEQWESYSSEITSVIDAGDRVVVLLHERGVSKGGATAEGDAAQVWTVRDGKVRRIEAYMSPDSARRAAGLDPS